MSKQSYFKQFRLAYERSLILSDPYIGPYQARVDLEAMAMKRYSAFLKAPALLEPPPCFVSYPGHSLGGGGGSYPSAEM